MKIRRLFLAASAALLASCDFGGTSPKTFGLFGHKGVYLTEHAEAEITLSEAKRLVNMSSSSAARLQKRSELSEEDPAVKSILARFGSLGVSAAYYIDGSEERQVRTDLYQGTDFLYLLKENTYFPFAQMNVKYIYIDGSLLDSLEEENAKFREDPTNLVSPFVNPYTYHRDAQGELVLQTHHFAELPSSVNGGIGATFRQDCELSYDGEGKLKHWQSSLGLYTSTPTGTSLEGYIFEATFEWTLK
ncbi:MAG: hypothetical protein K6F32_01960 [Bacilli bacterium]|nr:hypothetical protein [Bacilli bacterium]